MNAWMVLSLLLNVAVLLPVCIGIARHAAWANACYGGSAPARGILLAVYGAILLLSATLLLFPRPEMVAALLLMQLLYKIATPFTVGTLRNPVVISNLLIAAVHAITLATIVATYGLPA